MSGVRSVESPRSDRVIEVSEADLQAAWAVLENLTVSLDQIGGFFGDSSEPVGEDRRRTPARSPRLLPEQGVRPIDRRRSHTARAVISPTRTPRPSPSRSHTGITRARNLEGPSPARRVGRTVLFCPDVWEIRGREKVRNPWLWLLIPLTPLTPLTPPGWGLAGDILEGRLASIGRPAAMDGSVRTPDSPYVERLSLGSSPHRGSVPDPPGKRRRRRDPQGPRPPAPPDRRAPEAIGLVGE